ncbi:MAG: hypothetical protein JWL72_21 [Ilumatobacteraceae bacterium]|nr:hypothetical protein [Ilumatobacteraceae bacterium]MCU1386683.1 hypothetical protein [Ilumatobacteraceae bacterium]
MCRSIAAVSAIVTVCLPSAGLASAPAALGPLDRAATATAQAVAGAAEQLGPAPASPTIDAVALTGCDVEVLQKLASSDRTVMQWIIVSVPQSAATAGTLSIATVRSGRWVCALSSTVAQVGRQGVRPILQRRSGDDTTPAGIFPLGVVSTPQGPISFFGNSADPGALGTYRRVQRGDCYGANPNTPGYGHWRVDTRTCTGDDELLANNVQAYEHAALIGANTEPNVSGDAPGEIAYAAAIFLHRTTYASGNVPKPTSGCVSIPHDQLVTALRSIDPALNPRFAIGTRSDLFATPSRSGLPVR